MLRQFLRPITRTARQGSRSYHEPATGYKHATMDELPVPQGCWQANYDAKQKSFNLQLAVGVAYFVATSIYIISTGAIYLNFSPPKPKN